MQSIHYRSGWSASRKRKCARYQLSMSCCSFSTVSSLYPYRLCSKYKILEVLLDGLHDPESSLNKLREPNDVRRPVMEMIWDQVTEDWQVHSSPIVLTSPSLTRSLSSYSDLI